MEDRQPTTKSILENYSGNILDIPNGKELILDSFRKPKIFSHKNHWNKKHKQC